jgi:D-xylose transport system substrate-binding protein
MIGASKISIVGLCLSVLLALSSFHTEPKIKIGFLVHDLVTARWQIEIESFSSKITELGGELVTRNAFGDAETQIKQGKELIDSGVKVIAVVAQNGKALAELVDYANKAGTTIIAYDRMILNCDLPYYISFNSVKVGEMMADYSLTVKPKGNYVILNGPSTDNNAALVKRGVMNKLSASIEKGDIKVLVDKEMDSWSALTSLIFMEDFLATNKSPIDAIITAGDDMASGVLDAMKIDKVSIPVLTGQNATIDACKNIMQGLQTMTVYKDGKMLSSEGAILAMKIAKGEKIVTTATTYNGKINVPSILFNPVVIDKNNLRQLLVPHHVLDADLQVVK